MKNTFLFTLILVLSVACQQTNETKSCCTEPKAVEVVSATPPMGWNSFDAYDCVINEEQYKKVVDFMADSLLQYGWEYAVIDYVWWHPEPGNWDTPRRIGHPNIRYKSNGEPLHPEYTNLDEYGRLIPSIERFPSSANGAGFKPLADYVHSKGMKFGIHIMRGINRYATFLDKPIKGTNYTFGQIAETYDTCNWNNHMWGVDHTKPGAQEYYNSLFELYAQWEVDFIKADDMMVPPFHKEEIAMMHKAIENCGRKIVLSLSCGEAPLSQANFLKEHANMWRISADFWDKWESLEHNFDLLNAWASHIGTDSWPDADMIPFGHISKNDRPHGPDRVSNFTWPEHYSLMSLWCIARSPLMIGADLLSSPDSTMFFFTNPEVLAVNQNSTDNRQVHKKNGEEAIWVATDPATGDRYLALFNLSEETKKVKFVFEWEYLRSTYKIRDLWKREDMGVFEKELIVELPPHGAGLYRMIDNK